VEHVYDLYQRGMRLLQEGHFHQAAIPLAKAAAAEPNKASVREALARTYFRSANFESAAVEFGAVVDIAPTNDYALFGLGRSLLKLGRGAEALKPLALAACLCPNRHDYRAYRDRARVANGLQVDNPML
jgi:Flp pilus assembly protein TadD